MRALFPALLLSLCALCSLGGCAKPAAPPERPGLGSRIAFDYHPLSEADLDYLSRFDVVVTHDLAGPKSVQRLKRAGAKLFFYEWLPGFYYTGKPGPWERQVYRERRQWTLDPEDGDPDPMGARLGCKDYFYDMASEELLEKRVEELVHKARSAGYDGIFFDWGSGWYALKEHGYRFATDAFEKRHPGVRYDDQVNAFLGKLRAKGLYIALNGAFRSERAQLERHADLDVVESMFTSEECRRPSGTGDPAAESSGSGTVGAVAVFDTAAVAAGASARGACETSFTVLGRSLELANRLPGEARAVNPKVRFLFLNYALPLLRPGAAGKAQEKVYLKEPDRQALYYGLALSYLGGASGFSCGPDVSLDYARDDIYLQDLGAPLGPPRSLDGDSAFRLFAKGFVVASEGQARLEVAVPAGVRLVWDPYRAEQLVVTRGKVQLELTPESYPSGTAHPIGRIYLYEH